MRPQTRMQTRPQNAVRHAPKHEFSHSHDQMLATPRAATGRCYGSMRVGHAPLCDPHQRCVRYQPHFREPIEQFVARVAYNLTLQIIFVMDISIAYRYVYNEVYEFRIVSSSQGCKQLS